MGMKVTGLYRTLDTVAGNGSVVCLGWFENASRIKSVTVPIRTKHSIQIMTCRILIPCLNKDFQDLAVVGFQMVWFQSCHC